MKEVLIHIGYHKTGTTWLQNEIFTSESDYFIPVSNNKRGQSTLARDFIFSTEEYLLNSFDDNELVIKHNLNSIIQTSSEDNGRIPVISYERLSGSPHSSGFDSSIIARRIKNAFPNAKILIVIREQDSWMLSNYFQYLSEGGTHGINKYLNTKYDGKRPGFSPGHIEYHFLIEDYQEKFGKENVLVLPYELLETNIFEFFYALGKFLRIEIKPADVNKRHNVNTNQYVNYELRFLNYFIYSSSVNNMSFLKNRLLKKIAFSMKNLISQFIPKKYDTSIQNKLKGEIRKWSQNRFADSNFITQSLTGLDLSEFNYKLPPTKNQDH